MKYSEPLLTQLYTTLVFSGAGFLLGAWYGVCVFLRRLFGSGRVLTFLLDFVFCIGTFFVLFSCALGFTDGVWRMPSLCFSALGFILYQLSVGRLLRRLFAAFALFLRKTIDACFHPVRVLSAKAYHWFSCIKQHLKALQLKLIAAKSKNADPEKKDQRKKSSKKEKNNVKSLENKETFLYNKY